MKDQKIVLLWKRKSNKRFKKKKKINLYKKVKENKQNNEK